MAEQNEKMPRQLQHPGAARDVDLGDWLNGQAFHPADTVLKQLGHEAARKLVGQFGTDLWQLLPPGRVKSLAFTDLERVRFYANMALAVGGGPREHVSEQHLASMLDRLSAVEMPEDPRVDLGTYKADQLTPQAAQRGAEDVAAHAMEPVLPFGYVRNKGEGVTETIEVALTGTKGTEPEVKIIVTAHNEGENVTDIGEAWVNDPDLLESLASYLLTMANQLRALQAR